MGEMRLKSYCDDIENVENYEKAKADNFVGWNLHHRLETHTSDGERRLVDITYKELIALGMYWHRPASELIFMPKVEHHTLHNKGKEPWNKGKKCEPLDEEHKKKLSEAMKGKPSPNKGKHFSEETKRRMSETLKGHPSAIKGKHLKLVDGKRVYY